jgi:hypothetical protein
MENGMRGFAFAAALLLAATPTLSAQKLAPGVWTGTVTPPDGPTISATFDVRVNGDTTQITLKAEPGEFVFADINVSADRLTFTFSPGTVVRCTLLLQEDRSYSGDCSDDGGGKGVIVMKPPKAE